MCHCVCTRVTLSFAYFLFRAVASHRQLKELNPYVEVKVSTVSMGMESDLNFLSTYQVHIQCI